MNYKKIAIVISATADFLHCAGSIAKWKATGSKIQILYAHQADMATIEAINQQRETAQACMEALQLDDLKYVLPDKVGIQLQTYKPNAVYLSKSYVMDSYDFVDCSCCGYFATHKLSDRMEYCANFFVDISDYIETKVAVAKKLGMTADPAKYSAMYWGNIIGKEYAEAYCVSYIVR